MAKAKWPVVPWTPETWSWNRWKNPAIVQVEWELAWTLSINLTGNPVPEQWVVELNGAISSLDKPRKITLTNSIEDLIKQVSEWNLSNITLEDICVGLGIKFKDGNHANANRFYDTLVNSSKESTISVYKQLWMESKVIFFFDLNQLLSETDNSIDPWLLSILKDLIDHDINNYTHILYADNTDLIEQLVNLAPKFIEFESDDPDYDKKSREFENQVLEFYPKVESLREKLSLKDLQNLSTRLWFSLWDARELNDAIKKTELMLAISKNIKWRIERFYHV